MKIILIILLLSTVSFAKNKVSLGMKASNISGYGAFVGYKPFKTINFQLTGIPYILKNSTRELKGYSIGINIEKYIIMYSKTTIFLSFGSFYYNNYKSIEYEQSEKRESLNIGANIGAKYEWHKIIFACETGYKFFYDYGTIERYQEIQKNFTEKMSKMGAGIYFGFII